MSTNVTWNGVTYSIPASGELNWAALSAFLIALGTNAAISEEMKQAIRKAVTSPVTVSDTTDFAVGTKLTVAGAVTVNLPAGSAGRVFVIFDDTGDAATNNVTINRNGSDTIAGSTSLVLAHNRQSVILQYNSADTDWKILANNTPTGSILVADISNLGTNVGAFLITPSSANLAAALTDETGSGANVFANTPTLIAPLLGTPTSGVLSACTGLPISTGVSGLGTGVATFLGTPSSANLASALTDETGSGAAVFANTPTLIAPLLGTPTSGTLSACTGLPISTGVSGLGTGVATFLGTPTSANLASALTDETGSGANVFANTPTLVTPILGTPTSGALTNCTSIPVANATGVLPLVNGGTGNAAASANAAFNALSPLTTKGDVIGYSTVNARLAVGTNGQALTADSTAATGLKWSDVATNPLTTTGDIIYSSSGSTQARLAIGSTGTFLRAGATIPAWAYIDTLSSKSASYTVTDTDGFSTILMTTGGTSRTVTLPSAANNAGRKITVMKVDTAAGSVTLARAGSDTIEGATSVIIGVQNSSTASGQYSYLTLLCDGTATWYVVGGLVDYQELVYSNASIPGSTGATGDVGTLTVSAGEYEASASGIVLRNGATFTSTDIFMGIGSSSSDVDLSGGYNTAHHIAVIPTTFTRVHFALPAVRFFSDGTNVNFYGNSTASQTIRLRLNVGVFSVATPTFQGRMGIRRLR